jgi:hypothetical protein
MDPIIKKYKSIPYGELSWCPNENIIYQTDMNCSVNYDQQYYENYVKMKNTEIANKLNEGRTKITEKYCKSILDIGIGSGEFINHCKIKAYGYDINQVAVKWLKDENIFVDPYEFMPDLDGISFWDAIEHIPNPSAILSCFKSKQFVFISVPIFSDVLNVRKSKHYKPNEHYYYFSSKGLIKFMEDSNFNILEIDDYETRAGREDITTFVFQKN